MYDFDDELIETLTADDLTIPTSAPGATKDVASLLQRIDLERARGYSVASQEVEIGLTSAATPVRDRLAHRGRARSGNGNIGNGLEPV